MARRFRRNAAALKEGFAAHEVTEMTRDTAETFRRLCRVRFKLPANEETTDWRALAEARPSGPIEGARHSARSPGSPADLASALDVGMVASRPEEWMARARTDLC